VEEIVPENEINEIIPEPDKTGAKENQAKAVSTQPVTESEGIPKGGLQHYPLTTVVQAINELGIKGPSAMALLFASTKRIESDLVEEKSERKKYVDACDNLKDKYYGQRETNAVLNERLKTAERMHILQNIFLTFGGIFGGVGIQNLVANFSGLSLVISLMGFCFLIAGWLWPSLTKKEAKS
jgi:hypothetical protein